MSYKTMVVFVIVVIVLIAGLVWFNSNSAVPQTTTDTSSLTNSTGGTSSPSDSSDASINTDLSAGDSQMQNLDSDTSNASATVDQNTSSAQ